MDKERFPKDREYFSAMAPPGAVEPGFTLETERRGNAVYPWSMHGAALVVRLQGPGGERKLVKVYTEDSGSPRRVMRRLPRVQRAVARLQSAIPELVTFEYRAAGVQLKDGTRWPCLIMPYIVSSTLDEHVAELVKCQDSEGLKRMAMELAAIFRAMDEQGASHGDLDVDNILVEPSGQLRIVDFCGLYASETASLGSSGEIGKPNFTSPHRRPADWGAWTDRFTQHLLFASLAALSFDPDLYRLKKGDRQLLFTRADFLGKGKGLETLRASRSAPVVAIADMLERLWALPFNESYPALSVPDSFREPDVSRWAKQGAQTRRRNPDRRQPNRWYQHEGSFGAGVFD